MNAQEWFKRGSKIQIDGHNLFYYDSDRVNLIQKPTLVILHGYPTCGFDYYKALPLLESQFRVVVHDHLGFGYSDKPFDYSYSLISQAQYALKLWNRLEINQAHILAHDYGTSVATEIIAKEHEKNLQNFTPSSVTLCNGSIHIELAKLRLIQKLLLNKFTGPIVARLSNKRTLAKNLKNIYHDKKAINDEEIDALWTMMTHNNGRKVLHKTTQYIRQRYTHWERWIGGLKKTTLPIQIVWAENDPVAVIKIAELLHKECQHSVLIKMNQLGHFPMLENPEKWAKTINAAILDNT